MSEEATRSLLESKDHGVLCMGTEKRGYGLPLSYSYDGENHRIIVGFVNAPESKKRQFATTAEEVTLTVYNYEEIDSWESVIVTGTIHQIGEPDLPSQLIPLFFQQEDITADGQRWASLDDFEREWYELRIDDISGRYSGESTNE